MKLNRAYSVLEIKDVDEESRVIRGLASTPTPDRMGDIVKPEGAEYSLPLPLLWQHRSDQPIGHVIEAKVTKKGIEIVAQIAKGISEEIDRAWALIKGGLVRGLSIGFRALDTEQIPNSWGLIFVKWEWLELSAVTIPANSEATIQNIKSIDTEIRASSGIEDAEREIHAEPPPAAKGKEVRVVKLNEPARDRAEPFVIRSIKRN
jgi:HK97 family phage prohead protease